MICKNCGEKIADDSKFCEFCGKKVKRQMAESTINVRWLFFVAMVLVSASNLLFFEYLWDEAMYRNCWDWLSWLLVPILSFILWVPCLILAVKRKISILFTILMFIVFALNTTMVVVVGISESEYATIGYEVSVYKDGVFIGEQRWDGDWIGDKETMIDDIKSAIKCKNGDVELYCDEIPDYSNSLAYIEDYGIGVLVAESLIFILYLFFAIILRKKG